MIGSVLLFRLPHLGRKQGSSDLPRKVSGCGKARRYRCNVLAQWRMVLPSNFAVMSSDLSRTKATRVAGGQAGSTYQSNARPSSDEILTDQSAVRTADDPK